MTNKPYIILSAAMTIDGKIASRGGDPDLSDEEDWKEVHKLRTEVDAIMVGKGTILKDNPKLHIKYHQHNGYTRIVVDSNLETPLDSNVICFQPELYPTIICTTEKGSPEQFCVYEEKKVKIIKSGTKEKVDLVQLMPQLYDMGIRKILLEGGGTLNWSFIELDLIDEMRLTIAPWIAGGKEAVSLVEGKGFERMAQAPRFKLLEINSRDNYVVLRYRRNAK